MEQRNRASLVVVAVAALVGWCIVGVAGAAAQDRYQNALGLAIGLNRDDVSAEKMLLANFRISVLGRGEDMSREDSAAGFLQPEVFYWERKLKDFLPTSTAYARPDSDLGFGLNFLILEAQTSVSYFFGVGINLHHLTNVMDEKTKERADRNRLGGNVQIGVELPLSKSFTLWGAGRWLVIQGSSAVIDTSQLQVYGGLGIRF
jgi:hypothetical protein